MSERMKAASIACLAALPILALAMWFADITARYFTCMIVLTHGGKLTQEMMKSGWPGLVFPLIGLWTGASIITLCLAKWGVFPIRYPTPPTSTEDQQS